MQEEEIIQIHTMLAQMKNEMGKDYQESRFSSLEKTIGFIENKQK